MKRDLFRKYVWLIELIRHAERISFEEINENWMKSPLNIEKAPLALRTFHNHREAIEHLFGLRITCDRSHGNKYYLEDCHTGEISRLKIWMLQTLGLQHLVTRASDVPERILLDSVPYEKYGLISIIEAMECSHRIIMECDLAPDGKPLLLDPYALRLWKNDWYLLAFNPAAGEFQTFNMRYSKKVTISEERFSFPYDFDARQFYSEPFGPFLQPEIETEDVSIRIEGFERDRARIEPLHPTQKEVETDGASSVFTYRFAPTEDFMSAIFALGDSAEVLAPESLRARIADRLAAIAARYK